jgi:hypothetical protein
LSALDSRDRGLPFSVLNRIPPLGELGLVEPKLTLGQFFDFPLGIDAGGLFNLPYPVPGEARSVRSWVLPTFAQQTNKPDPELCQPIVGRDVFYGRLGRINVSELTCSCLNLILACIVYWQASEISRVLSQCDPATNGIDLSLLYTKRSAHTIRRKKLALEIA